MDATRVELPEWESIELLQRETVGRLCVIDHGYPLAFPINYRMVRDDDRTRFVFRTNPNSAMARYEGPASLEVDRIDSLQPTAWSVIVRGTLRRALGAQELPNTYPLVATGRFQWVELDVIAISGRRFTAQPSTDAFVVEWEPTASTPTQ